MAPVASAPPNEMNLLPLVGPILIGSLGGWFLLGVLSMQLYVYHIIFANDRWWIKFTVYGLYLADLVQTVFITDVAWTTFCKGWGNPSALVTTDWGFAMTPVVSGLISGWVQIFFAWRVWVLGRSRFWTAVTTLIVAIAVTEAGAAIATGIKFAYINNVEKIYMLNTSSSVWLAGSAITDVLIAASMVYFLNSTSRKYMWSKVTNRGITKLIRSTVETGVLTALVASLDLAFFLGFKHNNVHVAFAIMLSKLYTNALMASLNSRSGVYDRSLPTSSRDNTYGDTIQFTTVGVAVTRDDSVSMNGTVVRDSISGKKPELMGMPVLPREPEGIAPSPSSRSVLYFSRTVG